VKSSSPFSENYFLQATLPISLNVVYITKDRTGKPEKKKEPEPKFYGDPQKVIDKIVH
jgi:hypothetical protein